jgi:hypothetical protein
MMTFSMMTLSIMQFSTALSKWDSTISIMIFIAYAECHHKVSHFAECHFPECHYDERLSAV